MSNWGKNLENRENVMNEKMVEKKRKYLSIEDRGLKFLIKNSKIIWLLVLASWGIAYYIKNN